MTGLWVAVGVLGALLIAGAAGMFLLLAMGRLCLDLGWGRSFHPLGPITIRIAAPRDLVFEIINAPYTGRAPRGSGIELLATSDELVVAAHHTKVHFYTARTVEVVEFEPPSRVRFRHLTGPVPYAVEQFTLEESDGGTEIRYSGEVGRLLRPRKGRGPPLGPAPVGAHRPRAPRGPDGPGRAAGHRPEVAGVARSGAVAEAGSASPISPKRGVIDGDVDYAAVGEMTDVAGGIAGPAARRDRTEGAGTRSKVT